jgi:LMBR1-like membrane protein
LQSYTDSGHRSRRRRLVSALRENLRYQAILLGIFGLGLLYILLTVKITSFSDFQSLLIALANTYGLLLAIFCMGHGFVTIPRRMWAASSLETEIRETERAAVTAWEEKSDAEDESAVIASEIAGWERTCEGREDALANWVRELAIRNPDTGEQAPSTAGRSLTEDYLSSLTRRERISRNRLMKAQTNWGYTLRYAGYLYDLKSAAETSGTSIQWKLSSPGRVGRMIPQSVQYVWFLVILPWWRKILAVFAAVVSVAIVWSEIVHNWNAPVLSLVGIVIRSTGRHWFLLEVRRLRYANNRACRLLFCCTWRMPRTLASCVSRFSTSTVSHHTTLNLSPSSFTPRTSAV